MSSTNPFRHLLLLILFLNFYFCFTFGAKCRHYEIECESNGECVNLDYVCDSDYDCLDRSDESVCKEWRNSGCSDEREAKCERYGQSSCVSKIDYCSMRDPPCTGVLDQRICQMLHNNRIQQLYDVVVIHTLPLMKTTETMVLSGTLPPMEIMETTLPPMEIMETTLLPMEIMETSLPPMEIMETILPPIEMMESMETTLPPMEATETTETTLPPMEEGLDPTATYPERRFWKSHDIIMGKSVISSDHFSKTFYSRTTTTTTTTTTPHRPPNNLEKSENRGQEFTDTLDVTLSHPDCPHLYTRVGNHCLSLFYILKVEWGVARRFCETIGGELISFSDDSEEFISLLKHMKNTGIMADFWLGGRYTTDTEGWRWLNDDVMDLGSPFWAVRYNNLCQERKKENGKLAFWLNRTACYHYQQAPRRNSPHLCAAVTTRHYYAISDEDCLSQKSPLCLSLQRKLT